MAPDRKHTEKRSLAAAASDQIRAIIEAAEQTAAQIRAEAEQEAASIRSQAEEEASAVRSQAQTDVQDLLESIRSGVSRLSGDLELLEDKLQPKAAPARTPEPPAAEPQPASAAAQPASAAAQPASAAAQPASAAAQPTPEPAAAGSTGSADADIESARLVALNMALDGASREDVDRYLSENFAVSDRKALLDDVYASVGG